MSLLPRLSSRIWAIQKEIKDAYPKKVCHMPTRHANEKRERKDAYPKKICHMSTRHVKKKRRKKYIAHVQEKKYKERDRSSNGVHPLSTKNISHTCTS
jgi:hypothetical protein